MHMRAHRGLSVFSIVVRVEIVSVAVGGGNPLRTSKQVRTQARAPITRLPLLQSEHQPFHTGWTSPQH